MEANTLIVLVERGGPVQLSFFAVPTLGRVREPDIVEENGVRIAHLLDLAGTKAAVVQRRAEAKDYLDMDALSTLGGVSLPQALSAAGALYGSSYNPQLTLKALAFFDEGNLSGVPLAVRERLLRAVKAVDLDALPPLDPIAPRET